VVGGIYQPTGAPALLYRGDLRITVGYNRFSRMRRDASWLEIAIESVEELGPGLVTAALLLFLIHLSTSRAI
jgi:hypothetical protein